MGAPTHLHLPAWPGGGLIPLLENPRHVLYFGGLTFPSVALEEVAALRKHPPVSPAARYSGWFGGCSLWVP